MEMQVVVNQTGVWVSQSAKLKTGGVAVYSKRQEVGACQGCKSPGLWKGGEEGKDEAGWGCDWSVPVWINVKMWLRTDQQATLDCGVILTFLCKGTCLTSTIWYKAGYFQLVHTPLHACMYVGMSNLKPFDSNHQLSTSPCIKLPVAPTQHQWACTWTHLYLQILKERSIIPR